MATHTLESLLQWMRDPDTNVMWGWNMIAVMARNKTNQILMQEYLARYDADSYLPAITAEVVAEDSGFKQVIHDYQLDAPRLSFTHADLDDARAQLAMAVLGGVQIGLRKNLDLWHVTSISEADPLQGPWLTLELNLEEVPGTVGEDNRVRLDLQHSDNFRLTLSGDEYEQRLSGDVFKDLFNELPPQQRVFVLGSIEPGGAQGFRPQSFTLRTQSAGEPAADARSAQDLDGALLVFVRMQGSDEGDQVGASFRYLIPNDADQDFSATVVLSRRWLRPLIGAEDKLFEAVQSLLTGNSTFARQYDSDGIIRSAVAQDGELYFAESGSTLIPMPFMNFMITTQIYCSGIRLLANSTRPLSMQADAQGHFDVSWETSAEVGYVLTFDVTGNNPPDLPTKVYKYRYDLSLSARYEFVESDNDLSFKEVHWDLDLTSTQLESNASATSEGAEWLLFIWKVLLEVEKVVRHKVEPKLKDALQAFGINIPIGAMIKDCVKLNFGHAIESLKLRRPRDTGVFGRINPLTTTLVVSPSQVLMPAGGTQQFQMTGASQGIEWSVHELAGPQRSAGSISPQGLYRAPAADAIGGHFQRVRVTASEPASGKRSSALVTVGTNALTINPLYQECSVGERVELQAGRLGEGSLQWSIKSPVAGESGTVVPSELPGGDHTYCAVDKKVRGKLFVLDEIEVCDTITGQARSAHVLVLMWLVTLSITAQVVDEQTAQLTALTDQELVGPVEWQLWLGPGAVDAQGVYRVSEPGTARFALMSAKAPIPDDDYVTGYIIVPLPLSEFARALDDGPHSART
ncbi:hypothetical protein ASF84_04650 [Pseudomonas sp. Leaf127]|uniref:hypothetical protein n=1 Tax=Pseudomonas sp. Leaf127 TaxID=1736267 RepID=UPI00070383DF|nr:hypothetical protein [Pseudomonas sp. Leaf127]KQQ60007.1 hypothetical protein ASF84_04650 [Pseudomonas sp. Leaf127]